MKKLVTLVLAAGLVFGACSGVQAVDFNVKGLWQFGTDYAGGGSFMSKTRAGNNVYGNHWNSFRVGRDNFWMGERINLQLDAVASENLSGTVNLEIGDMAFGNARVGSALGTDGTMVRVKNAYMDWTVPNTQLKLRMGLQSVALPSFAFSNTVFESDVAGIVASYKFNDNVTLSGLWMRPYNDNWAGTSSPANYMDNYDLGALLLPMKFEGVRITPWAMGGAFGPNVARRADTNNFFSPQDPRVVSPVNINAGGQPGDGLFMQTGLLPAAFSSSRPSSSVFSPSYTTTGWGGVSFDVNAASPWRFAGDFVYGTVTSDRDYLNRSGWYGTLLGEYKMDWATPGLYGWYYSGDDSDPHNGSERMPTISTANHYFNCMSSFGFRGTAGIGGGKGVLGGAPDGLWGVGARIADMSFVDKLSHTVRFHYFGGTNDPKMASYITGRRSTDSSGRPVYRNFTDFNSPVGVYMTTADTGIEVNFDSKYKLYDNLTLIFELGYIHLMMDDSVWGGYKNMQGNSLSYTDAWKASAVLLYMF